MTDPRRYRLYPPSSELDLGSTSGAVRRSRGFSSRVCRYEINLDSRSMLGKDGYTGRDSRIELVAAMTIRAHASASDPGS